MLSLRVPPEALFSGVAVAETLYVSRVTVGRTIVVDIGSILTSSCPPVAVGAEGLCEMAKGWMTSASRSPSKTSWATRAAEGKPKKIK